MVLEDNLLDLLHLLVWVVDHLVPTDLLEPPILARPIYYFLHIFINTCLAQGVNRIPAKKGASFVWKLWGFAHSESSVYNAVDEFFIEYWTELQYHLVVLVEPQPCFITSISQTLWHHHKWVGCFLGFLLAFGIVIVGFLVAFVIVIVLRILSQAFWCHNKWVANWFLGWLVVGRILILSFSVYCRICWGILALTSWICCRVGHFGQVLGLGYLGYIQILKTIVLWQEKG